MSAEPILPAMNHVNDGQPWVSVKIRVRGSSVVDFIALLLGRLTRVGGKTVAAEVDLMEFDETWRPRRTGRITLVPISDVELLCAAARERLDDLGHPTACPCGTCASRRKA